MAGSKTGGGRGTNQHAIRGMSRARAMYANRATVSLALLRQHAAAVAAAPAESVVTDLFADEDDQ